jgi:hypothetical protein
MNTGLGPGPIGPALPSAFPMRRVPCRGLGVSDGPTPALRSAAMASTSTAATAAALTATLGVAPHPGSSRSGR